MKCDSPSPSSLPLVPTAVSRQLRVLTLLVGIPVSCKHGASVGQQMSPSVWRLWRCWIHGAVGGHLLHFTQSW